MNGQENPFPVGYERFHRRQLYNFQLNRPYSFGYARLEDLREAGEKVRTFSDWKNEMVKQAEKAVLEGRLMNAAFYYRGAEFYVKSTDPEKIILYEKFVDLFDRAFANEGIERHPVPYEGAFLSAMRIPCDSPKKGVIVIHGGFDSLIEEFYSTMKYFSSCGYEVIGFDGPGQGATLRKYGLPIAIEWERPTKAVLDYFQQENVTLIGISMGGWLCLRAAAFESRIRRVIADGHGIDYMKSMPKVMRDIHLWCLSRWPKFMDRMAEMKFEKREGLASWVVDHLKFITRKSKPMEALDLYVQLNDKNIHSELVKQDVLILSSRDDHFVPFKMHDMQIRALGNARSVTGRVFTREENAGNHCQTGNWGLALKTMAEWIENQ
jgi:pimeloyl-ACP methyl ester carboxylesterase